MGSTETKKDRADNLGEEIKIWAEFAAWGGWPFAVIGVLNLLRFQDLGICLTTLAPLASAASLAVFGLRKKESVKAELAKKHPQSHQNRSQNKR